MDTAPNRVAAVLLMLFQREGETYIVLTKRTDTVADHKGQISLPGGSREPTDSSLIVTALRETEEELGISPEQIEILGQLPEVDTATSNFTVTPVVGRLAAPPSYRPDPREVDEVIEMPLSALRKPDIFWQEEREGPEGKRSVYFFSYRDHIIWGATARILMEYLRANPS